MMRRRPRLRPLLLSILAVLSVAGCGAIGEPENVGWITAIGVDEGPDNDYAFTFQLAIPKAVTGSQGGSGGMGGGGGDGQTAVIYTVQAPDVVTALAASQAFVARRPTLIHAKAMIVGEAVARAGISQVLGPAVRFREFRRTMSIMVVRGTAQEFLQLARPQVEANPALWFELMTEAQRRVGYSPVTRVHEFAMEVEQPGLGARAALVAPRPDVAAGEAELGQPAEGVTRFLVTPRIGSVMAGDVRREGEVPVEFMGTAVFREDELVGMLTGTESNLVNLLRGTYQQSPWDVAEPLEDGRVTIMLSQQQAPNVRVTFRGGRPHFSFSIRLEGDIVSILSDIDYTTPARRADLEQALEQQVRADLRQILAKTLNDWGTDVYLLGHKVRRQFPTIAAWDRYNWIERIKKATYDVDVRFKIRRHGQQVKPAFRR